MGKCVIILVCISVCLINSIGCSLSSSDARKLNRTIQLVRSDLEYRLISALVAIDDLRDNMGTCKCTDWNKTVTDLIAGRPDHSMSKVIERKIDNSLQTSELRVMQGFQDEKVSRKIFEKKITDLIQDQISSPVHGGWATWSSWGSCSATCGIGLQRRDRSCSNPYPGPDGNPCFGDYSDYSACFDGACADGSWSAWSSWGACSASCLGGLSRRDRTCNNPFPSIFGHDCNGNSEETKICNTHYCQDVQNGGWSVWSSWSTCSADCNVGKQIRQRFCTNPQPSPFGHACSGSDWQTKLCNVKTCNKYASIRLRLVDGTSSHNGRVEVFLKGQWGTVCDDHFTDNSAKVVCRMLGLPTTTTTQYQSAHYGQGTGPIWLNHVKCTGTEHSILDCPHLYTGSSITNCKHGEDVGVSCA